MFEMAPFYRSDKIKDMGLRLLCILTGNYIDGDKEATQNNCWRYMRIKRQRKAISN